MSDNYVIFISEDPNFQPTKSEDKEALKLANELNPDSEDINSEFFENSQFIDCGANLTSILCPHCKKEIDIEWWEERVSEDIEDDYFKLENYILPCCGKSGNLNNLVYNMPQGFSKYKLEIMNPNKSEISQEEKNNFEKILKTKIKIIYQHI